MNGQTMSGLPQLTGFGEDATKVKEVNFYTSYYKMVNKYGREVYIAPELLNEKLKKGFTHTDKVLYTDKASDRVRPATKEDPAMMMAKAMEKLVESNEDTKELVAEVAEVKRRGRPAKKVEETAAA